LSVDGGERLYVWRTTVVDGEVRSPVEKESRKVRVCEE
jgi:hypothetical protein